ncbi:MAG: Gx transporter family protein [Clostridia bacterium]|nr:Gx transporter family protein [Clostridia bacterium]
MTAKRITRLALFTAAALILNLIESLLPPLLPFAPGARMGLSNLVTLVALALLGYADAYIVLIVRCLLGSIFGGNVTALIYSLSAGLVSLTVQLLLYRFALRFVSVVGISLAGAAVHNCVQLAVASIIVQTNLIAMLPLMMAASAVAGLAVGIAAFYLIKYLPIRRRV